MPSSKNYDLIINWTDFEEFSPELLNAVAHLSKKDFKKLVNEAPDKVGLMLYKPQYVKVLVHKIRGLFGDSSKKLSSIQNIFLDFLVGASNHCKTSRASALPTHSSYVVARAYEQDVIDDVNFIVLCLDEDDLLQLVESYLASYASEEKKLFDGMSFLARALSYIYTSHNELRALRFQALFAVAEGRNERIASLFFNLADFYDSRSGDYSELAIIYDYDGEPDLIAS